MRSCEVGWALSPKRLSSKKRERHTDREHYVKTQKHGEDGDVKTVAEIGVILLQAKGHLGLLKAGRGEERSFFKAFGKSMALPTPQFPFQMLTALIPPPHTMARYMP